MNLQEKAKLEKIALNDIEKGIEKLEQKKNDFEVKPTKDILTIFTEYKKAKATAEATEEKLSKLGYDIQNNWRNSDSEPTLSYETSGKNQNKEYKEHRKNIEQKIDKMNALKRQVVIGLYTTQAEAKKFLDDIVKQITELLS